MWWWPATDPRSRGRSAARGTGLAPSSDAFKLRQRVYIAEIDVEAWPAPNVAGMMTIELEPPRMVPNMKPCIHVQLSGTDGNAFAIMGAVTSAMKRNVGEGYTFATADEARQAAAEYQNEAMSGDYDNLLRVSEQTVSVS